MAVKTIYNKSGKVALFVKSKSAFLSDKKISSPSDLPENLGDDLNIPPGFNPSDLLYDYFVSLVNSEEFYLSFVDKKLR